MTSVSRLRPSKFLQLGALSALTFVGWLSQACDQGKPAPPPSVTPKTSDAGVKLVEPVAHVPVGEFSLGSSPGEPGRNPELEPAETKVELGPFRIDAFPYPGEGKPPRLGTSPIEAAALCAAAKGRLCTELEWERACRGPDNSKYSSGAKPCSASETCLSGFDVASMGSLLEWTASSFGTDSALKGEPVAKGAPSDATPEQRRCARRGSGKGRDEVGFRCCYGAPNAASLKEPTLGPAYREVEISKKDLQELLASDERTKDLAQEAQLFKPEAARTVLARGTSDSKGFVLTTQAIEWQPVRGSRFFVVAGKSAHRTSFVLAYFMSEKKKSLAGSFIMKNEPGPIALAYAESIRPRLHFSSCWGCPGETGKVLFREPEELVLLQP